MNLRFTPSRYPAKRALTRGPLDTVRLWKKTVPIKAPSTPATTNTPVGKQDQFPGAALTGIRVSACEWIHGVANTFRKVSLLKTR